MLALLCRIHTARPVCARNHGVGLLDESTVLNNLRHTAICEIRHRPGIVTQLVVVVASNHMVNCAAGALHIKWALIGKIYPSAAAVGADCTLAHAD